MSPDAEADGDVIWVLVMVLYTLSGETLRHPVEPAYGSFDDCKTAKEALEARFADMLMPPGLRKLEIYCIPERPYGN